MSYVAFLCNSQDCQRSFQGSRSTGPWYRILKCTLWYSIQVCDVQAPGCPTIIFSCKWFKNWTTCGPGKNYLNQILSPKPQTLMIKHTKACKRSIETWPSKSSCKLYCSNSHITIEAIVMPAFTASYKLHRNSCTIATWHVWQALHRGTI